MGDTTLAYFSHSYRQEDRDVNLFFWNLFCAEGFFFTVDPQSQLFSIPYLESMMSLSNCFVAVITRRQGAPAGCSPYILFEYGLAVEAQKPSLVFVEQGLPGGSFARDAERVRPFNRNRLPAQKEDFRAAIRKLADKVRGYRNPDLRLQQPVGLVIGDSTAAGGVYTPEVVEALRVAVSRYDRQLEPVTLAFEASFRFCLELDQFDFLIMEVHDDLQQPWVAGYVMGRGVPSIKVRHLDDDESAGTARLPAIVARHVPEHTTEAPVVYWRTADELLAGVTAHVARFNTERIEFHTEAAGQLYFRRAGRRTGKVFISNASVSAPMVQKLITMLRFESIDYFHYQAKDAIQPGTLWLPELERQIEQSSLFLAVLTEEFVASTWCRFELQVALRRRAEGKIEILPFVLSPRVVDDLKRLGLADVQAAGEFGQDDEQAAADMVKAIDAALKRKPALTPEPAADVASTPPATRVLTERQRAQLVDIVTARLTVEDAGQRPTWIKVLLVRSELYAPLAGEDYTGSAAIVALRLIEKCEALGLLPDGQRALVLLVTGLRTQVSGEHAAALDALHAALADVAAAG